MEVQALWALATLIATELSWGRTLSELLEPLVGTRAESRSGMVHSALLPFF